MRLVSATLAIALGVVIAVIASSSEPASTASLEYRQTTRSAHFKVTGLPAHGPGTNYLSSCWQLEPRGGGRMRQWCAERAGSRGQWRLVGRRKGARARFSTSGALLAVEPAVAGVRPGLYRWSHFVSPCRRSPIQTELVSNSLRQCAKRSRRTTGELVRVRRVVAVGCTVKGPAQVKRGPRRGRLIALTFDDGPAPLTPQFLDSLRRLKVRSTFFLIGSRTAANARLLRRMQRDGHELANHSWDHANLGRGGAKASAQLRATNRAIRRVTGFTPCVMRPPYGASSRNLVRRVRAQGMTSILWDVDPLDWRRPGVRKIAGVVRSQSRAGSIILEHDGGGPRGQTLAAIPKYVRRLKARGYEFVTVSELLGYRTRHRLVP